MGKTKEELYRLIDRIPEQDINKAKKLLERILKNEEDKVWLEADFGDLPPFKWGSEGPPKGKSVRYRPGIGLVVEGGKGM